MLSSYLHLYNLALSLKSFISGLWRVSLAKYLLVLRVLFPIIADGTVYHGYCKSCFYPAVDEE